MEEQTDKDKRIGTLWDPVNASPEEIARACMQGPPKERWDYQTKNTEPTLPDDEEEGNQ